MKKSNKLSNGLATVFFLVSVGILNFLIWQESSQKEALGYFFILVLLTARELLIMAPRQIKRKVFCALVKIGAITEPTGNYHIKSC